MLRQVELNIIPNITCVENFSAISIVIRDDVICTFKGPTGTESTCSGDSGGPLMVRRSVLVQGLLVNVSHLFDLVKYEMNQQGRHLDLGYLLFQMKRILEDF